MVEGRDIGDTGPFSGGDHGSVDRSEWQVVVAGNELGDPE